MKEKQINPENLPHTQRPEDEVNENKGVKIYFLPTLMTAGNLFCG